MTITQSQAYIEATFQALTDAILPSTPQYGNEYPYSASDMGVYQYVIYSLDHYISIQRQLYHTVIPLAYPTAMMLDAAAMQLVNTHHVHPSPQSFFPGGQMFSCLSRQDRIRVLATLENLNLDLYLLPSPYQNNGGLIKHMTDALNRFSMLGYYSEWPAYGSTRLLPPENRRLEFFPLNWQLVGYPGVSLGYRDFRGFILSYKQVKAAEAN